MQPEEFIPRAIQAAKDAGHIWPEFAACEAALESGWDQSELAVKDNNLFGMKQHEHPIYGTVKLPTREFLKGGWVTVEADWVQYPDWAACFRDRMETLKRLAPVYPHYQAALTATTGAQYLAEVSKSWSTDPARAGKALSIYLRHVPTPSAVT
jgi:flagellum-specific peptidoglycan hydrolase FlgJ